MTSREGGPKGSGRTALLSLTLIVSFFALLELALWLAGVKPLLDQRDPFEGFAGSRLFEEDDRGVYATPARAVARSFNYQEFKRVKPAGGFRLFTLGGSSAYGFPWGARAAFTRLLGDALRATWPDRIIEAVNASGMSYGSLRLRILAREVTRYSPDLLIVYEGHNEFIEARLRESLEGRFRTPAGARAWLHRWRLYSALTRTLQAIGAPASQHRSAVADAADTTTGELLGLDVAREQGAGQREEQKRLARERLEENLRDIAAKASAAGARVIFCTVASNVRDWAPNQSLFDPVLPPADRDRALSLLAQGRRSLESGDAAGAIVVLQEAARLAEGHAEITFILARALEAQGRLDDARSAYARARDEDAQPSRALGSFNETIRSVARDTGSVLVDIERAFEQASPGGLVGFGLIEDYVHPTREGHRLIALELWKAINEQGLAGSPRPSDPALFARAIETASERSPDDEEAAKESELLYNQAFVLEHQGLIDQAIAKYRECLALSPGYTMAAHNLGRLLHATRHPDLAAEQFRRALASEPTHVPSMVGLGLALIGMDRQDEAARLIRRATEIEPRSAAAWSGLGHALALSGDLDGAADSFERAASLEPNDAGAKGYLGAVRLMQGRMDEAVEALRASLALRHDQPRVRDDLADALMAKGRLDEAEELYRGTLAADPADERAISGMERIQRLRAR